MNRNPQCCGGYCQVSSGEVRVYPLGGGGNLILCRSCWANENFYRHKRGIETQNPANFPKHDWFKAEVYENG